MPGQKGEDRTVRTNGENRLVFYSHILSERAALSWRSHLVKRLFYKNSEKG